MDNEETVQVIIALLVAIGGLFLNALIVKLIWNWQFDYQLNYWQCFWLTIIVRGTCPSSVKK